jgi:hypothetical protein
LAEGMQEDGLYKPFTNQIEQVWKDAMIDEGFFILDESFTVESFSILEETITNHFVKSMIDSLILVDESM